MRRGKLLGMAAAGMGATAAALTAGVVANRRGTRPQHPGDPGVDELGSLHSTPLGVEAEDGVVLHAEIDEVAPYAGRSRSDDTNPTLVFVHGFALNLDCWHFQRQYFRGKRRLVFYDLRSHGRSDRSAKENATIEQLGTDLRTVLDQLAPQGPVVLVGHSMGGMAIIALAEQHPELFGYRVVGAALIATTAGGLRPHRLLSRLIPDRVGGTIGPRLVAGLARAPLLVETARRGSRLSRAVTDTFAFGGDVPASYVRFVDTMLAGTPFEVLAEFFPNFDSMDKFSVLHAFEKVPTYIVCGTDDLLTSVGHSRKMAAQLPGARLVECRGAGHMVILEQADKVNDAVWDLLTEAESGRG
ncbi:MAG: Putative hydrolase [uncultured Nocardioidaceae bacterium]|uniref:Hydrolase n=1 Tax=uncultured Nocardioidaceae bacterium TaxID=253824 RepID=A0A6J4LNN4_9ACTN|nr:MAG: Putative hydrolase [uncultured Nocardioidaceae bacterium]